MTKDYFTKTVIAAVVAMTAFAITAHSEEKRNTMMSETKITPITKADEARSFDEYEAVAAALQPYITAAQTGDGALSRSAFLDHARIVGTVGGEYSAPTADEFGEAVASMGPSPDVRHRITWIDISGPAAAAKVEFYNWGGFRFTDFFVLYKKDGEWKISGKVYDSHSQN